MFTVKEISTSANVTTDSIRHYVRIGLLSPSRNPDNDYKLFSEEDVKKVRFIRQARDLGFSLNEIKLILSYSEQGQSPCQTVRKLLEQHIEENRIKLKALNALQNRMEQAMKKWQSMPDDKPNGKAICHLIESITGI